MPKTGGYIEPLVFMLVMGLVGSLIQASLGVLHVSAAGSDIGVAPFILLLTVAIVVSGFFVAALYFVIWKLMGSQESFETAYRCNAYVSALMPINALLSPLPYVGHSVAIILTTLFLVIASIHVHKLPVKKSWLVFGIIGVLFLVMNLVGENAVKRMAEMEGDVDQEIEELDKGDDIVIPRIDHTGDGYE